jgi:glycosyltransferase involved in cell wall biosynthesis
VNGHIFRTPDVRRWLEAIEFNNPNELESRLQSMNDTLLETMASFEHSVVTSIPLNIVNDVYFNRAEWSHGAEELDERFRLGQRLDLSRMDFSDVRSAHQPIVPVFSGDDGSASQLFSAWARERALWLQRVRDLTDDLRDVEKAKKWLDDQRAAWEDAANRYSHDIETLQTAQEFAQRARQELENSRDEAIARAALARREGDAVSERLDAVLRSPAVRLTVQADEVWRRSIRRAKLAYRLVPSVRPRRLLTLARLASQGDLAAIKERARFLAGSNGDRDAADDVIRTPMVLSADPYPQELPLLSVVVVCFNYGRFVREAISSVLDQTAAERCELIVVDGGSDDPDTILSMSRLAADPPPRTRVLLRSDGPHLVGNNRNYGIERAEGRYVACLDADDLLDPVYFEVALYLLERRGYDIVSTPTQSFGLADDLFGLKLAPDLTDMMRANELTTVAVFRRELWEQAGGFHDVGLGDSYVFEDWKLWVRMAALGARMTNIRTPLFRYRVHSPESLSRQGGDVRALEKHRAAVLAFNEDVISSNALTESARRRELEITVTGAFDNLQFPETDHRRTILLALPFMLIGGAERLLSAVATHLESTGYRVIIVTTVSVDPAFGDSSSWFEAVTSEIYHLPRLLRRSYWEDFLDYLVKAKRVDVVLIAGSEVAYEHLPTLRREHPDVRVADLLFNTQGHVTNNRRYSDQIDLHLCESKEVREWLVANGEHEDSILVVESGIDTADYHPAEQRGGSRLRVGFSGRLSEEKAPLTFVELARSLRDPRLHFLMTGAGPLESAVRQQAAELPDDHFSFLGIVDDIRTHLASLDVLVLPSTVDGRPVVVLEALALGVPVIASGVGGLPALVRDGETGFLVDVGDVNAIAAHLRRLVTHRDELKDLQSSARTFAEENLDARTMNMKYEGALRGLMADSDRTPPLTR